MISDTCSQEQYEYFFALNLYRLCLTQSIHLVKSQSVIFSWDVHISSITLHSIQLLTFCHTSNGSSTATWLCSRLFSIYTPCVAILKNTLHVFSAHTCIVQLHCTMKMELKTMYHCLFLHFSMYILLIDTGFKNKIY